MLELVHEAKLHTIYEGERLVETYTNSEFILMQNFWIFGYIFLETEFEVFFLWNTVKQVVTAEIT